MIAVVGGGILGMAVSEILRGQNKDVVLYEKNNELGGQAGFIEKNGINLDKFYHAFFESDKFQWDLLRRLGIDNEVNKVPASYSYYASNQIFPLNSAIDFIKFNHRYLNVAGLV